MAQLTVANLFNTAYDATASALKLHGYSTADPWAKLMPELKKVAPDLQFDRGHQNALDDLRKALEKSVKKGGSEGDFLADGGVAAGAGMPSANAAQRCAALKLLRHTYYHARRGNHRMWIVSLPKDYVSWPDRYLKGVTAAELVKRLSAGDEHFTLTDRKHLSDATQKGLRWVHQAMIALDDLGEGRHGMKLLKRWFGDEDTTTEQLKTFAATLKVGLKKIAPRLSDGALIVTDFVPIRNSPDAGDEGFRGSEAFVWADKREIVYIEKGFFEKNPLNVLQKDLHQWARIMVHEMTHREAATDDKRYAWAGIKPVKGSFPASDAMVNADSWAFFIADAGHGLNKTDLTRAQNGTTVT